MSVSESSAYYEPPSVFTFSVEAPVQQDPNELARAPSRTCSVRGCSFVVEAASTNKMCLTCRGKHRIYASTKRTRRKLEKAAVQGQTIIPVEQIPGSAAWMPGAIVPEQEPKKQTERTAHVAEERRVNSQGATSATSTAAHWDHNVVQPHFKPASTSSELAGALTLPKETTNSSYPSAIDLAGSSSTSNSQEDTQSQTINVIGTERLLSETSLGSRFCTVKGCKAIIPASYSFKMCEPCRNRYRGYGTKKRAKWKAERQAFDQELQDSSMVEEDKRKHEKSSPLSESPEDIRTWEPSTDERLSLSTNATNAPHSVATATSTAYTYPAPMIQNSLPSGVSLDSSAIRPESPTMAFPARMCTVSHCHKVLPSNYTFKRCEQHRLQNRYHSKLKRVREKVIKAAGPLIMEVDINTHQVNCADSDVDVCTSSLVKSPRDSFRTDNYDATRQAICSDQNCNNLIDPGEGWHLCRTCRTKQNESQPEQLRSSTEAPQVPISVSEYCGNFLGDYDQESRDAIPVSESSVSDYHYTRQSEPPTLPSSMLSRPALAANMSDGLHNSAQATSTYPLAPSSVLAPADKLPLSIGTTLSPISFLFRPAEGLQQGKSKAGIESNTSEVQLSSSSGTQDSQAVGSSENHTSDATRVSTSNDQCRVQEASQQTMPALPVPYISPATIPQYPFSYCIPHPYAYTIPFPPNSSASTSAMPPYLTGYPYVYPGYAYPISVPYRSVQVKLPTTSRYEATAAKRQKKRSSTHVPSEKSAFVQVPERQKSLDTTQDDSATIVFSHYKPEATKRKRRKVMHLSPEQIEEIRARIQQSKGHQTPSLISEKKSQDDITYAEPRECENRKCHRKIPPESASMMCSKCRTKFIKKHQAKTKQTKERLKLEPRKVIAHALKVINPLDERFPLERTVAEDEDDVPIPGSGCDPDRETVGPASVWS